MFTLLAALVLASSRAHTAPDPNWAQTQHSIQIGAQKLDYTATAGFMPLVDGQGVQKAKIFFTAYTAQAGSNRPITFAWNGGPGGSSLLLHMLCMGPRRIVSDDSTPPKPPTLADNPDTLLTCTDLVFIDPVGTGFSSIKNTEGKPYWGVEGDLKATEQFINSYLKMTGRQKSPVFLAGESYGTFRAAGLALPIIKDGVDVKGLVLISNAIHFDTLVATPGNDVAYDVFLPTYAATAAYYKKLQPAFDEHPERAIDAAERIASTELWQAFEQGDNLSAKQLHRLAEKLSTLTSLSTAFIEEKRLRIDPDVFRNELLKAEHKTIDKYAGNHFGNFDTDPPGVTSCFVGYLRDELNFKTDGSYLPLNLGVNIVWAYGSAVGGFPDQSQNLKQAMVTNPKLRLFVAQGIYDLTTPFYGEDYTFRHLGLPESLRQNWKMHLYKGGHMMYLEPATHTQLHQDIESFIRSF